MVEVEFFFDLSCPWTYLAAGRLHEAAVRTGAGIRWRPIRLAEVDPQAVAERWPADAARRAHAERMLAAWADYCARPLRLPENWPAELSLATRGAVYAAATPAARAYVEAVWTAEFGRGESPLSEAAVIALAQRVGLEAEGVRQALADPATDERLTANARELLARGGFASATMFVGEEMFQGNANMPLVEFALGQASGRRFVMPGQHGSMRQG